MGEGEGGDRVLRVGQASRMYMEVSKACTRAVGEQDTCVGVRNSENKKKAFTYLFAYWVLLQRCGRGCECE